MVGAVETTELWRPPKTVFVTKVENSDKSSRTEARPLVKLFPISFFKNGPTPASISFIYGLLKQTGLHFLQQFNVKNILSIQYMAPGFETTTFRT